MSSDLYAKMLDHTLDLPEPQFLNDNRTKMPYFFVGDNIFGLHENLMKPYASSAYLTKRQRIYNYRISRARITIECTFGILTSRWRIFEKPLKCKLKTAESIIMAAALLHNFIITENLKSMDTMSACSEFEPGENGSNFVDDQDLNIHGNSAAQREALADYFSSPHGAVPWQDSRI